MKKIKKRLKRIAMFLLGIFGLLGIILFFFMKQTKFGKIPTGARLTRIEQSPNYRDGKFRNIIERPQIAEGYSYVGVIYQTLFDRNPRATPKDAIPSIQTNLKTLALDTNLIVWFGHSSFYLQLNGKRFLVDPVFSGNASPIPGSVKAYKGSNSYQVEDMPDIDYLIISHDHYDHLDYETIKKIEPKIAKVICGLGVGAHFEYWNYSEEKIIEKDWNEELDLGNDIILHTLSTQHSSGRGFIQRKSLWLSFMFVTPEMKIYYSGDGGYDDRFKEIYKKFGAIDWAIMENGQYNPAWEMVHELPNQMMEASLELHTKSMLSVHHSKFTLARHDWDEPLKLAFENAKGKPYRFVTPMIGEVLLLYDSSQTFKQWWKGLN